MSTITDKIRQKVQAEFSPQSFELFNDSSKHAHHASMRGAANTTESHYRLEIVSDIFTGLPLAARHRLVYKLLADELAQDNGVHALQLKTKTPEEIKAAERHI